MLVAVIVDLRGVFAFAAASWRAVVAVAAAAPS